ncbi:phosphatidylglycerophosphatase A [bacterium]|nr:phosphatidylglycerophosphatase A [bacterium]
MNIRRGLSFTTATWFGSGLSPFAPGTAGSLAALPFILVIAQFGQIALLLFAIFAMIIGMPATIFVQREKGGGDPQLIVIDEVVGQTLAFVLIPTHLLLTLSVEAVVLTTLAFLSFRFFDVWKPWPASYFDSLHSAWGIMLDDVVAGVYAMLFVWLSYSYIVG